MTFAGQPLQPRVPKRVLEPDQKATRTPSWRLLPGPGQTRHGGKSGAIDLRPDLSVAALVLGDRAYNTTPKRSHSTAPAGFRRTSAG